MKKISPKQILLLSAYTLIISLIFIGLLTLNKNQASSLFSSAYIQKTPTLYPVLTLALPITGDENDAISLEATLTPTMTETATNNPGIALTSTALSLTTLTPFLTLTDTETPTVTATTTLTVTPTLTETLDPFGTGTPEIGSGGVVWSVEVLVPVSSQEVNSEGGIANTLNNVEAELNSTIQDNEIITDVSVASQTSGFVNFKVMVAGEDGLAQFRQTMFGDLNEQIDLMGGAVILDISGDVIGGQVFPLLLESNPSTGFIWEVESYDASKLQLLTTTEFDQKYNLVGAPSVQTIQFLGLSNGPTTISLFYGRPWLAQSATTRITVDAGSNLTTEVLDFSAPIESSQSTSTMGSELEVVALDTQSMGSLPPTFDWSSKDGTNWLTPVRNQGSCGSCWAFSTVGVFESAIKIQGGGSIDLSEQYLVSCNNDGYSCSGGWFANSYHFNKFISPQTQAGAVLESAFPYTASNSTCSVSYNHPYKLTNWYSIAGDWATPSVDQIKTAISTYGPVAAAICVGPNFSNYRSGVFTTDEKASCNGGINHAILLTGWDDSSQSWILRNSWGTGWGESGYMKIRWGISNVGYAANYVVYTPANSSTATATSTASITNTPTIGPSPTTTLTATPSNTPTQTATPTPTATAVPVANDNFDTPYQISLPSSLVFSTTLDVSNASRAYDDPIFACTNAMGYKTVWFIYQPMFDGQLTVETTNSNYDTVLGIWTGTRGNLTSIACNDDISYPSSVSSKISDLAVNRGEIYYIEVASYSFIGSAQLNLKVSMKIPTPSNLVASDGTSASGVILNWDPVQGADNYNIFRASSLTGTKSLLGKVTENIYIDTSASSGEMFAYWVTACSGDVCSDYSNSDTGFRILEPVIVTASLGTVLDAVNLSWKSISKTVYYEIYRTESIDVNPLSSSALAVITKTRSSIPTSFKDKTVLPGKSYYYWVRACRNSICSNLDGQPVVGWRGLTKPGNLSASDNASLDKVVVAWSAVSGAINYDVYRAVGTNGTKELIGSGDGSLRFDDITALPGITYTYWLKACVNQNCSVFSSATTGWRSLNVPVNLFASDGASTSSINLTWDVVTDASSYRVFRSTSMTGKKSLINTISSTSYVDQGAAAGPIYYYWVTSCVNKNCSNYSSAESGYRLLTSPATMSASDGKYTNYVQISWPKVKNATQYIVYRASSSDGEKVVIGSTSKTSFSDVGVVAGYIYNYWVTACNNGNCGAFYGSDSGWRGIAKLSGLMVNANNSVLSVESGTTGASLAWTAQEGATSYIVSRSTSSRGTKVVIGLPTINSWVDSVAFSKTYYYFVQSCVENRCSPYSNAIKFTAPKGY